MLTQKNAVRSPVRVASPLVEHPFLLLRKADYSHLQARALKSPWKEQKATAISQTATLSCSPADGIRAWAQKLARIFSTTALAYILDPQNRPRYRDRIVEHLKMFDPQQPRSITAEMQGNSDKMLWIYSVPTGNAFFQAVLALDIIHDDLPVDELAQIEQMLSSGPANYFLNTKMAWRQGGYATQAIWPIYQGRASTYEPLVEEWHRDTLAAISTDGVFNGGTGYACARWTQADREHKALFGEVLAHVGILPDWYDEPRLQKFHEWVNAYAYTPFRIYWSFGDSGPANFDSQLQPGPERAYRYSELASGYAAWLANGKTPFAGLSSYVLAEKSYPEPQPAPSRIFPDGGAWLKQKSLDPQSLSAALWNLKSCRDLHAHKETNAICLAAYGEMLLRGGGYNGWNSPEHDFTWSYINDRAIAANTVLFDYAIPDSPEEELNPSTVNDHIKRHGVGISSSLLTQVIDFARGDSGDALPNGRHVRNLLFVHPSNGAAGYYAVIDELTPTKAGATGHIIWHPGSANYVQTIENQEYTWTVREFSQAEVGLTIFLGSEPAKCAVRNGVLANWGKGINAKYLASNYAIADTHPLNVITVLFPHDATHPKASFARVKNGPISGVSVTQGQVEDFIFESRADTRMPVTESLSAQAQAGVIRSLPSIGIASVLLLDAVWFRSQGLEFTSTAAVVVLLTGNVLHLTADQLCHITLMQHGLKQVTVNNHAGSFTTEDIGSAPVTLSPGQHLLTLTVKS